MRRTAVDYYLKHGRGLARAMRALGYPKSRKILRRWIDEIAPGRRKYRGPDPKKEAVSIEKKAQVVAELEARTESAAKIAERYGLSRTAPYVWRRAIMMETPKGETSLRAKSSTSFPTISGGCMTC